MNDVVGLTASFLQSGLALGVLIENAHVRYKARTIRARVIKSERIYEDDIEDADTEDPQPIGALLRGSIEEIVAKAHAQDAKVNMQEEEVKDEDPEPDEQVVNE